MLRQSLIKAKSFYVAIEYSCAAIEFGLGWGFYVATKYLYNPGKLEIFKNDKMIIIIINCHNGSEKPRKFSRSRMTKQTATLNLSREI